MEFKNGYNFMYQKAKAIYASKIGRPDTNDEPVDTGLTDEEKKNIKLVYETKEGIVVNFTGLPTVDDKPIELTVDGELVIGPSGETPADKMVPFEIGQRVKGFYFGNVKNGDINEEFEAFLLALKEYSTVDFVFGEEAETNAGMLAAVHITGDNDEHICIVYYQSVGSGVPTILYSNYDGEMEGIQLTKGYMNLIDGKFMCSEFPVQEMNYGIEDTSWNGKFIGAIVSQPAPTVKLNKMAIGDTFKNFHFDKSIVPTKDDFVFDGSSSSSSSDDDEGSSMQMGYGPVWGVEYKDGSGTHQSEDGLMVIYAPAGALIPIDEQHTMETQDEMFGVATHNGMYIYLNDELVRLLKLTDDIPEYLDPEKLTAGWQFEGNSFKDFVNEYSWAVDDYYLSDDTYMVLPVDSDGFLDYIYAAPFNGKIIGLTDDDYFDAGGSDDSGSSDDGGSSAPTPPVVPVNAGNWSIDKNFSASNDYGVFSVNGTASYLGSGTTYDNTPFDTLYIGYTIYNGPPVPNTNYICATYQGETAFFVSTGWSVDSITLNITDGSDIGNQDLYIWLTNNIAPLDPEVSLTGFYSGQEGNTGTTIVFDTNKANELADFLMHYASYSNNGIVCDILDCSSSSGGNVLIGVNTASYGRSEYLLVTPNPNADNTMHCDVLFATKAGSIPSFSLSYTAGFQNLTAGKYEIKVDNFTIGQINDSNMLNGRVFGYEQATPEEPEEPEEPEDEYDCADTWTLSYDFSAGDSYGVFSVNGSAEMDYGSGSTYTDNFTKLLIGYDWDDKEDRYYSYAGHIVGLYENEKGDISKEFSHASSEGTLTLAISDGDDVYNESLYNWLVANS